MSDDELLERLGAALGATDAEPDPARVAALRDAAVTAADAPTPPTRLEEVRRWRTGPGRILGPAIAVAAAVALFVAGLAIGLRANDDDTLAEGTVEYDGPFDTSAGPTGMLTVVETGIGRVITIDTDALPILPTGEYYEVWFVSPDDSPDDPDRISAGTFHPDAAGVSKITLAAAVDPALYPGVEITAEPGDGNPEATGPVVLEATIGS